MYESFLIAAAGIIIVTLVTVLARDGLKWQSLLLLMIALLGGGFVGARLGYLLLYPPAPSAFWGQLFDLRLRNFTEQGAAAADFLILMAFANTMGFHGLATLSRSLPGLTFGLVVARMGCVVNDCCYGKVTTVPWGIPMEKGSLAYLQYMQQHPFSLMKQPPQMHFTQGYEIAALVVALIFALWLGKRFTKSLALPFLGFASVWLLGRFVVFFFRAYPYQNSASQWLRGPGFLGLSMLFFIGWFIMECRSVKT